MTCAELSVAPSRDLTQPTRDAIVQVCTRAFRRDFANLFDFVTDWRHLLAYHGDELIGHACWATRWQAR